MRDRSRPSGHVSSGRNVDQLHVDASGVDIGYGRTEEETRMKVGRKGIMSVRQGIFTKKRTFVETLVVGGRRFVVRRTGRHLTRIRDVFFQDNVLYIISTVTSFVSIRSG